MIAWESDRTLAEQSSVRDFAEIWRAAEKIVYSKTLQSASTARTRIEREFDAEAVRRLKAGAGRDLAVGGPRLASEAFEGGLVDELHLFVAPIVVGGGKRSLPENAAPQARARRRTAFPQRHGLPPLPHEGMTMIARPSSREEVSLKPRDAPSAAALPRR
jgi:riboflavin biosynthesis pyrimidine reductase